MKVGLEKRLEEDGGVIRVVQMRQTVLTCQVPAYEVLHHERQTVHRLGRLLDDAATWFRSNTLIMIIHCFAGIIAHALIGLALNCPQSPQSPRAFGIGEPLLNSLCGRSSGSVQLSMEAVCIASLLRWLLRVRLHTGH